MSVSHSSLTFNTAERRGGAVAVEHCSATLDAVTMASNAVDFALAHAVATPSAVVTVATARSHEIGGGAMYVEHNVASGRTRGQRVRVTNSVAEGNTAVLGGGFYAVSDVDNSTCSSMPWACAEEHVAGTVDLASVTWNAETGPNVAGKNGSDVYVTPALTALTRDGPC